MGRTINRVGRVVSGDYQGYNVFWETGDTLMIVSGDRNGQIVVNSLFSNTAYRVLKRINKETVERFEEVSATKNGPSAGAVAEGLFWLGPIGGLLGAAASSSSSADVAIYFKDGQKCLLRMLSIQQYQELKRILFVL